MLVAVWLPCGGGSGIPSADSTASCGGGNGIPSASCIRIVLSVFVSRLTEELTGTTMVPTSSEKHEARAIFLKRMDNTSRCDPLRFLAKAISLAQNVPIAEHFAVIYG